MSDPTSVCIICGHTQQWHEEKKARHPFTRAGDSLAFMDKKEAAKLEAGRATGKAAVKVLRGLPSDPAVRVLLMRKGLISQDELTEVEREIRQAQEEGSIVVVHSPPPDASGSDRDDRGLRDAGGSGGSLRASDQASRRAVNPLDGERGGGHADGVQDHPSVAEPGDSASADMDY